MENGHLKDAEKFLIRFGNGEHWIVDGQPVSLGSLSEAIMLADRKAGERFAAGLSVTDSDIEIVFGDDVLTLPEAREQLMAQVMTEAGRVLDDVANGCRFDKLYLRELARKCRLVIRGGSV